MQEPENICLTIAGIDPTHGAGLTRDVITFESLSVKHMAVCTALTIQDDKEFISINWVDDNFLIDQISFIQSRHHISIAKIGIIKNLELLYNVISLLTESNPDIKIIWDPIIKSSTGFNFHADHALKISQQILQQLSLITPNKFEVLSLTNNPDAALAARELSTVCPVMLKGGHLDLENKEVVDTLYINKITYSYTHPRIPVSMHGTGCRFSAVVCAYLYKGEDLPTACLKASDYVYEALNTYKNQV